ncbi:hypothetical protein [Sphingorhabdus lutea]|uniref:hypothetical protein n=1 Tax=Sphingorhabdus lutea TaxID=1913578 RepID=UPI0012EC13DF|nr:hypothetical protein [Sphingorhabdus lutea]
MIIIFLIGSNEEKFGITALILGTLTTTASYWTLQDEPKYFNLSLLFFDTILLIILILFCLKSRKFWPIWVSSFHLIAVLTHISHLLLNESLIRAYSLLQGFWVYPMYISMILGAYGYRKAMMKKKQIST